MDERELKELFKDAPGEPPPAKFTAADVSAASRRATARARRTVVGAAALLVFAGSGVAAGVLAFAPTSEDEAGAPVAASAGQPSEDQARPLNEGPGRASESFPEAAPQQGGAEAGEDGPRAGSTSGCKGDRELATALADELPVAATATTRELPCGSGVRAAAFRVEGGTVIAAFDEPGSPTTAFQWAAGSVVEERSVGGGGRLYVVSRPAEGTAPLQDELPRIADALAAQL